MEISIPCYISDGGALKIKQAAKHSAFLTDSLLMRRTASPQRCCLCAAPEEQANIIALNLFVPDWIFATLRRIFIQHGPAKIIGDTVRKLTLNANAEYICVWLCVCMFICVYPYSLFV